MKAFVKYWQIILTTLRDFIKISDPDIPKKWNCYDELETPKDLAGYKKNQLNYNGYRF